MEILKDRYTITELSEILKITDHALRFYEKEFGMTVPKDDRGRRYYTAELANIMYQIKAMRSEGLEIKAIKKLLYDKNIIVNPPPVVIDENTRSIVPITKGAGTNELQHFFDDFREQMTSSISTEVSSVREHLSKEIYKSKLELGACVENSIRKLESKMEKHFQEVDRSLGNWREKNKKSFFKRFLNNSSK